MNAPKSDTAFVRFNAEIKAVWIVKFSICTISNIFVKSSLKIELARSQTISTKIFSLDFDFGAIDQRNELKFLFEFCVYPPRHRFNRSSLLRSYIGFIIYFKYYIFLI